MFLQRRRLARGAATDQFTEAKYHRVGDAIEDAIPRTFPANESGVEQDLKVLRDVWLIPVQMFYDLADCHRTALQGVQDAQTARFAQDLETAGH